jgi:hypothetical protein
VAIDEAARAARMVELRITESELKQLCSLDFDEATWRNEHELKVMLAWVNERHAFIRAEIRARRPTTRRTPDPGEVPIQSHRSGPASRNGGGGGSTYGDKYT